MPFIPAREQTRPQQCKQGIRREMRTGPGHPPGTEPGEPDGSVAEEMACLADEMMNDLPVGIADATEKQLKDPSERSRCLIGAEVHRRLHHDDGNADGHGQPGADPESKIAPSIRHGSWALRG